MADETQVERRPAAEQAHEWLKGNLTQVLMAGDANPLPELLAQYAAYVVRTEAPTAKDLTYAPIQDEL